mmetsp:Transcript_26355/g.54584  ORF Transcript_26355/g.54584 Transcript_26355/m.54584 type:complete len:287 (-) Transcript_26355:4-864(-)|eukprot:CAMPEP_0171342414 /NCGR_PEP_ID=MMETSP0878-20121228/14240_1 /TAXON_ID=67004 /ORGANISM="Thalassiosira weissflogii, Strain CCMP1336" /LENGTH=286 /DNA_ID=CAMNT_0011845069 /DNA_START=248 /DNA_END=1108 /DNA_ORIENTATION=-
MSWEKEAKSGLVTSHCPSEDTNSTCSDVNDVSLNKISPQTPIQRRSYHSPQMTALKQFYGSTTLTFSSHACFFIASVFFVKLGCVDLDWLRHTLDIPYEVFESDDEVVWAEWAEENEDDSIMSMRKAYLFDRSLWYAFASYFLFFVGLFDLMRYGTLNNAIMILAGVTGIISGVSTSFHTSDIFNCISVHLYFLHGINMICRKDHYVGWQKLFRLSDVLFLSGSMVYIFDSYAWLNGARGTRFYVTDIIAAFIWLGSSVLDIGSEIYFLPSEDDQEDVLGCYIERV